MWKARCEKVFQNKKPNPRATATANLINQTLADNTKIRIKGIDRIISVTNADNNLWTLAFFPFTIQGLNSLVWMLLFEILKGTPLAFRRTSGTRIQGKEEADCLASKEALQSS